MNQDQDQDQLPYYPAILLILNCAKYADKRARQCGTWLKEIPDWLPYYHVIGNPNLAVEYALDDAEKILYVRVEDDYNSLPQKTVMALAAMKELFWFLYIFKTDDDQAMKCAPAKFFNVLRASLEARNAHPVHYGGFVLNIPTHISKYYMVHSELPHQLMLREGTYCNGRFYLLSYEAANHIASKSLEFIAACREPHNTLRPIGAEYYIEDYAIGVLLDMKYKEAIFKIDTNRIFCDEEGPLRGQGYGQGYAQR